MYLSSHEIARSRDHVLSNLLSLSEASLEAGQRISALCSSSSREAIEQIGKQLSQLEQGRLESISLFPAVLWLDNATRASQAFDHSLDIFAEAQKAAILSADANVRIVDEIFFSSLNRAIRNSPWEFEFGLRAMRSSLETVDSAMHDVSVSAIETVERLENEVHQIAAPTNNKPHPKKRASARAPIDQ